MLYFDKFFSWSFESLLMTRQQMSHERNMYCCCWKRSWSGQDFPLTKHKSYALIWRFFFYSERSYALIWQFFSLFAAPLAASCNCVLYACTANHINYKYKHHFFLSNRKMYFFKDDAHIMVSKFTNPIIRILITCSWHQKTNSPILEF